MCSLAVAALAATACNLDKTLHVNDVDVATPASVTSKSGLPVVYAGGRSDFQVAFSGGGGDNAVTLSGLLGDELRDIDTFPTRIEIDQRNTQVTNGTEQTWYRSMHLARASLERATAAFHQFDPTNPQLAELHALDGFMYVLFAEQFCNGVAYSELVNNQPVYGGPNTGTQSLTLGIAQFDSALAVAKAGSNEGYLAQVGKARALLDQANYAAAAAAATGVPLTFQYFVYSSENSTRENNGIYVNTGPVSKRYAVANIDGGNGLPFRAMGVSGNPGGATGDPRIRWYQQGIGQDGVSPAFYTLKYPSRSAPTVLADGIEAQLVIAENLLKTGSASWLDALNALRANTQLLNRIPYTTAGLNPPPPLTPLADPGSGDARLNLLFQERAFWMYLSSHRLGDMRRLIRQYGRGAETVFPTGPYQGAAGGSVGVDVNFPIPIDEQNNPKAQSCTDRNA